MMTTNILRNLFFITLTFILVGCSPNEIDRHDYALCNYTGPGDCSHSALQVSAADTVQEYHLGFVEYTDQGLLRDPLQIQLVLNEYYPIIAVDDVLLVTFIHGWHHSAKPGDQNIVDFRKLLTKLAEYEGSYSKQQKRRPRKVLGLYFGWRGDSISIEYLNALTFWQRKNTAHRVGHIGVAKELIKLEEVINLRRGMGDLPNENNSRLVIIGHSFGGAAVFSSLQNLMAERYQDKTEIGFSYNAGGFGDLVVLINPAFEAIRYVPLYDMSQANCRKYFSTQTPKLAILTSEVDYATKYAFPIGRHLSTLFETHTNLERYDCLKPGTRGMRAMVLSESEADVTAVGHFEPLLTHRLNPVSENPTSLVPYDLFALKEKWESQDSNGSITFHGAQLTHLGKTIPLNPYLNIQVDKALMSGHNDIWQDPIIDFIRDLIVVSDHTNTD